MENISAYNSDGLPKLRHNLHLAILSIDAFLKHNNPSIEKIEWKKSQACLLFFYRLLVNFDFIECSPEFFCSHFSCSTLPIVEEVVFKKSLNELPYIIDSLRLCNVLGSQKYPHLLLSKHFLDQYGKKICPGTLRTLLNKGVRNDERLQLIDHEIIDKVRSYKDR